MGGVFRNQTVTKGRPVRSFQSSRQQRYLKEHADSDRPRNVKHEQNIQIDLSIWIRDTLPGVHFHSDTASGAYNSEWEKAEHNKQQSDVGLPDMTIYAARRGYHGLLIELKKDGERLKMSRNGTKIRVKRKRVPFSAKYPTGWKIIERDYKIRMKDDWVDLHTEIQAKRHEELRRDGYCAEFAVGLAHAQKLICWYFDIPYVENTQLF
jgi:hypothetical protein